MYANRHNKVFIAHTLFLSLFFSYSPVCEALAMNSDRVVDALIKRASKDLISKDPRFYYIRESLQNVCQISINSLRGKRDGQCSSERACSEGW